MRLLKSPIWRAPTLLGVTSSAALVIALVVDGPIDLLSSLVLGVPVLVGAWYGMKRKSAR